MLMFSSALEAADNSTIVLLVILFRAALLASTLPLLRYILHFAL